ncbi:AAA family ATPase [Bacteroides acidifaciens]|jgi:transitional endoplasmic reticulum ATPase|uniref:AAA family ATPase n=1 Tax=Bacteroides acidifaciens TaxID=85831 RepID=UPI00158A2C3F|nr:AAA family ATPase [Bacteroides acidifaciens]MDE6820262.1 AAA family ATPase [Bacteroides acidifaciens]MDE6986280.1 AAA family ATPase [Bacteroides acidifaciens]
MLFNKNDKIASYTVAFPHKQGSYAETYRVKDANGKIRFLKLINYSRLNCNQVDDSGRVTEVEIAKKLQHHNLCQYIDSGNLMIGGRQFAWLVTEFVSGETLLQRIIRDDNISVYEIKNIATSVLSALSFLHSLSIPIIHNEVTIQNVFLNLVGSLEDLKLIDLGYARFLNQTPTKPILGEMNPFYLAPERFSGVCSVQSDLYSVGAMMYHLLYGKLPWFVDVSRIRNEDKVEAILAERDKELELPQINKFELDCQLLNCIAKALNFDAEDRFQTAEDFIKAISGETIVERQSTKKKILSSDIQKSEKQIRNISSEKGQGFAAIAGMDELKQQLREEIIEPLHNPEEYERYGVTIPNGMLLYGPPGCGKTFFAKHFAEEVGFNFVCVTPAALKSRYVNATQENIAKMFKEAEEKAPTIIFIDEMNEIVPNRESDVHEMSRSAVNEMLAQMDRTGERGVFVIGATNYPHMIDPAILRAGRLDKKYYIGVPDMTARMELFKLCLEKRPYDFGIDYKELACLTENYVSADIQLIVNDASRFALKLHSKITMQLLKTAIANTQPSLNDVELKRYEDIRTRMSGSLPNQLNNNRPRIGFK